MRHGVSALLAGVVFVFVASAAGGAPTAPGSRLWVARTNGGLDGYATSLATDGARVFVTGSSSGNGTANEGEHGGVR